jgi:hypothetical protein
MAKPKKIRNDAADQAREPSEAEQELGRDAQLCDDKDVREALLDIYKDIEKGFDQQADRCDANLDYWEAYNCELGQNQFYNGNSQIFVPIIQQAVNARKTRFVNQMFPQNGRYVEVTTEDGDIPHSEVALVEHYVRQAKLRTRIAPALVKNGDIEGQYTIQCTWETTKRTVARRVTKAPEVEEGLQAGGIGEDIEDIEEETIESGKPVVNVIADSDLLVLPATANSIEEAINEGGSVTTLCRWTPAKIKRMIAEEAIDETLGKELLEELKQDEKVKGVDKAKEMVDAAGIKGDGRGKYALIYRTWVMLTIKDERRIYLVYFGGKDRILSCKRNPYWSDRIDIFSCPVDKVDGSFKGISRLKAVVALQYQANDAVNEAMDSAAYALMPIIAADPERNPKVGSFVLSLAAVWEADPNSIKFMEFPHLWKDGLEIVATTKTEIFQTLSVNPAQITQANNPRGKKPNQAEIANEQQIDILTTADAVTVLEDEILTPLTAFILELDHQYRDKALKVKQYGELGAEQTMKEIPPIQMNKLYQFRWFGVEQARNAQQMQQQIAGLNVVKEIPPAMYPGYSLDAGPALAQMFENLFGPRIGPRIFKDKRKELSVDPAMENQWLEQGMGSPVHGLDDHQKHLQVHSQALKETGDPTGKIREHMMAHIQLLQAQQRPAQMGGPPGQGGPRPGAQPGAQRPAQAPPGAIHADNMKDPAAAPRAA